MDEFPPLVFDGFFPWFGDFSYGRFPTKEQTPKKHGRFDLAFVESLGYLRGGFGILDP